MHPVYLQKENYNIVLKLYPYIFILEFEHKFPNRDKNIERSILTTAPNKVWEYYGNKNKAGLN